MKMTLMAFQKLRLLLNHVLTIGQDIFSIKKIRNVDLKIPSNPFTLSSSKCAMTPLRDLRSSFDRAQDARIRNLNLITISNNARLAT
jgi:hypothetical protein